MILMKNAKTYYLRGIFVSLAMYAATMPMWWSSSGFDYRRAVLIAVIWFWSLPHKREVGLVLSDDEMTVTSEATWFRSRSDKIPYRDISRAVVCSTFWGRCMRFYTSDNRLSSYPEDVDAVVAMLRSHNVTVECNC